MDAEDLGALPPEEFTAARTAAAKAAKAAGEAAGGKQISALRRSSTSAWLVNRLTCESPELLDQLLAIGSALAQAQAAGSGDALRDLGQQRRDLVAAVTDQAVAAAGRSVTPAVRTEVEQTLEAALADPPSADAVRSGRLVRALSFAGFGGVDLAGAVAEGPGAAAPAPKASPQPRASGADRAAARQAALDVAQEAALSAAGALDDAVRRSDDATAARATAQDRVSAAREHTERLEDELARARADLHQAVQQDDEARRAAERAARDVGRAQTAAEQAREALDRLRRGPST